MHENQFFSIPKEPVNVKAHASVYEPGMKIYAVSRLRKDGYPKGITKFLGGIGDYLPRLHNFWVEQLSLVRLHNFLKEECLTVLHNF